MQPWKITLEEPEDRHLIIAVFIPTTRCHKMYRAGTLRGSNLLLRLAGVGLITECIHLILKLQLPHSQKVEGIWVFHPFKLLLSVSESDDITAAALVFLVFVAVDTQRARSPCCISFLYLL